MFLLLRSRMLFLDVRSNGPTADQCSQSFKTDLDDVSTAILSLEFRRCARQVLLVAAAAKICCWLVVDLLPYWNWMSPRKVSQQFSIITCGPQSSWKKLSFGESFGSFENLLNFWPNLRQKNKISVQILFYLWSKTNSIKKYW